MTRNHKCPSTSMWEARGRGGDCGDLDAPALRTGASSGHFRVEGHRKQCGPRATRPCEFQKRLEIQISM